MAKTALRLLPSFLRRALGDTERRPCPDEELLSRFVEQGDALAFEAILSRHGPMVLDVCRSLLPNPADAEDAFQATFLVLARQARNVRRAGSLGCWLHGVARRMGLKARTAFARRQRHESALAPRAEQAEDPGWGEVRQVLHEELARLSERHRGPLVLCYLQGRTQDEAAALLGMSRGTLKRRLERGRALLRDRLVRRGLGPCAVLLAAAWPGSASAHVPAALLRETARAGPLVATGKMAGVSADVLAVVEGGSRVLLSHRLKLLLAASLALGLAGVGLAFFPARAPKEAVRRTAAPPVPVHAEKPARTDRDGDPLPAQAVARLGSTRFRSDTWVSRLEVVPGGGQLLGMGSRSVLLWDAATGKEVRRFEVPRWREMKDGSAYSVRVESFAASPDGKLLAVGTCDSSLPPPSTPSPILLFELPTGKKLGEWPGHKGQFLFANAALRFVSPALLVSAGGDRTVRLWDVTTRREVRRFEKPEKLSISGLVSSPDGKNVFGTGWDGEAGCWVQWDVESGATVRREGGLPGPFVQAALSPDGLTLAVSVGVGDAEKEGAYNEVRLYSAPDGKERARWRTSPPLGSALRAGFPQRNSVAFSPDGKTLATGGADQKVRQWDVSTTKEVGTAIEPYHYANNVLYIDRQTLATFDAQNTVKFWDAPTGKAKRAFGGSETHVTALACSPDGRHVATGGGGGDATVRVWEVDSDRQVAHLTGEMADVTAVQFSPDGKRIVSADSHGMARLWDWSAGREVRAFHGHKGWLYSVAFSPDGKRLATGDQAGVVRVWDVDSGKEVQTLTGHTAQVTALLFTPDGRSLLSASWDHSIRHWDPFTGTLHWAIKGTRHRAGGGALDGHTSVVTGLALSPGGHWLYSGSYDHTICVWEAGSGRFCRLLKGPERTYNSVEAIALSPAGTHLAAALGDDGQESFVHVWDVRTGERLKPLVGHHGMVTKVAFSPDGHKLISASVDTTALVWDARWPAARPAESARAVEGLWEDLGADDPARAYAAVCRGAAAGDEAVAALKRVLKPVEPVAEAKMKGRVRDLGSTEFEVREGASQALAALGPGAEGFLRRTAEGMKDLEARARVERVLRGYALEHRRPAYAVEMLEMIGTPAAKELLAKLAAGAPGARLTRDAAEALKRVRRRE